MLQPKKPKYRKAFRGKMTGTETRATLLAFGEYGLKSLGHAWVTSAQIEAARRSIAHHTKRGGKVWVRIFPDKPVTRKPAGARMGGGKGDVEKYVAVVRPGRIIFELAGVDSQTAKLAFARASTKLPVKTVLVTRP